MLRNVPFRLLALNKQGLKSVNYLSANKVVLGCWKPFRDLFSFEAFVFEAFRLGVSEWDLGENYELFGKDLSGLDVFSNGLKRSDIKLNYKIGTQIQEGFVLFNWEYWNRVLHRVISKSNVGYIDTLVLWGVIHPTHIRTFAIWITEKMSEGIIRSLGISNVSVYQAILFKSSIEASSLVESLELAFIQIKLSVLEENVNQKVKLYKDLGVEIQGYGLFHSGLMFNESKSQKLPQYVSHHSNLMRNRPDFQWEDEREKYTRMVNPLYQYGMDKSVIGMTSIAHLKAFQGARKLTFS